MAEEFKFRTTYSVWAFFMTLHLLRPSSDSPPSLSIVFHAFFKYWFCNSLTRSIQSWLARYYDMVKVKQHLALTWTVPQLVCIWYKVMKSKVLTKGEDWLSWNPSTKAELKNHLFHPISKRQFQTLIDFNQKHPKQTFCRLTGASFFGKRR